ncbi:hypothetical protein GCM10010320_80350 [Streptomyces caelestis]|uniref:Uncharacterized protein n=1 Tax=Streptomyces caelestis TaxID=36816 RepID=A0A7W9HD72_9ACTN|nr:hypothetical protein [Streptomyces caelestis]GGW86693.1 hypothetical protein GCM10010320_80350 [Streptomyces caelestis]
MICDEVRFVSSHRRRDQRIDKRLRTTVRQHSCAREIRWNCFESQVSSEFGAKDVDLLSSAEKLGSGQQVGVANEPIMVPEHDRYSRRSDITLVHDCCARNIRAPHHVTRSQLCRPTTRVRCQGVAAHHSEAKLPTMEQRFHISVHLNNRIALAISVIVDGCRGQVDQAWCRRGELRDQRLSSGAVQQWPNEKDGVDSDECFANGSGVCQVANHRLHPWVRLDLAAIEAPHGRPVGYETRDDLTADVACRACYQDRSGTSITKTREIMHA